MVIGYFHIKGVTIFPNKANTPLVVDGNGMLTGPVTSQVMQAVAGWNFEIFQSRRQVDVFQPANSSADDLRWQAP